MVETYQLSAKRPHIRMALDDDFAEFNLLQTPVMTFTALLDAAQSTEKGTCDAVSKPDTPAEPLLQRRLQNRVSCRKTRLKRKLTQHALQVLARDRQERHEYLSHLFHDIGVDGDKTTNQDELYRQLCVKSLHYALVDQAYRGWNDGDSSQASAAPDMTQDNNSAADLLPRRSKRLRRARDKDVSAAVRVNSMDPQTSLHQQWRMLVDGLQNVDLKLYRMEERELGAGVFEHQCHWTFVAVRSAKVQRDGEIDAVAVSGITRLIFHGRHVQKINISAVRRQNDVPFDFSTSHED